MKRTLALAAVLSLSAGVSLIHAQSTTLDPIVRISTNLGNIDVQLSPSLAQNTVANFLAYVDSGAYNGTVIDLSEPGVLIQGGQYVYGNGGFEAIARRNPVANEFNHANIAGTISTVLGPTGEPNTATSGWFFNLFDNSTTFNDPNGGPCAFGSVVNTDSLGVINTIAALQTIYQSAAFPELPVIGYSAATGFSSNNLVVVESVSRLPYHLPFFVGEFPVGNAVEFLVFANYENYFGYYTYFSDPAYIYHFDLGYEYVTDAGDLHGGIYLYDFASSDFFYTSLSFPFPYLYDFNLGAMLYYYPDTNNPGHYTTNPRYFYNFSTGQIITK